MNTTPTPVPAPSKVNSILTILTIALTALEALPIAAPEAMAGAALVNIIQVALAAYHAESGQPIDLTKIPLETPVS